MVFWRQPLLLLQLLVISALAVSLHWPVDDPASYQVSGAVAAAPFDGIPRPLIQNAPTTPNSTARYAATPFTQTSSNERCHRAIRHYSHNCQYIREHCTGYGDGIVNYVELYYCTYTTRHATVLALMAAWLALLFIWLGVSASEYFSPNISTLSQLMRLPESLAGVTLLALGNGAPDLFSTFSAVRAGSGALALGQLIGSASFIVSVVIGATTLVVPVYKVSQLSYLRELCFFVATIGMVAVIVLSERLSRGLAICMMALYVTYVITVMATTYYEEQYVPLEASVEGLDNIIPLQADQPTEIVCPEPSPRFVRPDSDSQQEGSLLRPSRGQTIVDNTGLQQRHRRQKTSRGVDLGLDGSLDQWSLDNPHGDGVSVRALGEFLHHHPKSLLAAAECNDIFDEMRVSQSHHVMPALEAYAPRPLQTATSSSAVGTSLCYDATHLAPVEISGHSNWPTTGVTPSPSPIWPSRRPFKISPHGSDQINAGCTPGAGSEFDLALATNDGPRRAESGADLYSYSQSPFGASRGELLLPSSSKAAIRLPLERRSQEGHGFVDTEQQTQLHAHSSTCIPTIAINSATFLPLPTALASASRIDMLAGSHQSPSLMPASPWDQAPEPTTPYLEPVSGAVLVEISRTRAVVLLCIPTLRHWRPDASTYLKLLIAVSALPVLLLSATVPVLARLPESKEGISAFREPNVAIEEEGSASSSYQPGQIHNAATSRGISERAESEGYFASARLDTQQGLTMAKLPAERTSLSRPSSSSHLFMVMEGLVCDRSVQASNAVTATWAEGVVSNVRSVMSAVFLYSVLCLSDVSPFVTSRGVSISLGLALAVVSLLGNLVSRHAQQQRYWLQVAPCFFGFACGMAWVYIIANEVVSITQALGLMLGLSEEILGLTVVGFGNSLGDLVTNLALTRMGYPMMAISACFGGPMLCLLIGVGVAAYGIMAGSGPDNDDAYRMPITSPTVLVSTACLLLNSLLFLIAIPRQGYHMTRAVGLAALTVYFTGMAVNVYLEW
ncbi:hypothetical protein GGI19_003368 [Coemansia pectinata]|uniref:Sodium/calcium exchanger membrane region domain-containing protein n=1 Tax=Coemansia pectinata TaxID=1052879 RepID=A0A9W8GTV5_9FUNG|nr:hypothetical protein GGI19_003368 [Coemansia pectinata]